MLLVFLTFTISAFAKVTIADLDMDLVRRDQEQIAKAETQRLAKLIKHYNLEELSRTCPEPDVTINAGNKPEREIETSPSCKVRYSDGTCGYYGADVVGKKCVPYCKVRYSDGTCGYYGEDICE